MQAGCPDQLTVAIIGGGPAGLMAAETLAAAGVAVDLFDAMPSVGRKFLLAGRGGLNLTHAEAETLFRQRYFAASDWVGAWLDRLGPAELRAWADALGAETFVGSSGRVFPREMKAAPLLRAWLHRLRAAGVRFHVRHRWLGWDGNDAGRLRFATPDGERSIAARATLLALGGGSWAKLGSDGAWVPLLRARGVEVAPLRPANCGFRVAWSEHFAQRFAGEPVKNVVLSLPDQQGGVLWQREGEFIISADGVEGSLIYACAAWLRERVEQQGSVRVLLDLAPGRSLLRLQAELARPRGRKSLSAHLKGQAGIAGVKAGLLRECAPAEVFDDPAALAAAIKALPLVIGVPRPLDEAISSAGGVVRAALDERLMLRALPGVFCAGEMLDWEAPTGGYLLTACMASGRFVAEGMLDWLASAH